MKTNRRHLLQGAAVAGASLSLTGRTPCAVVDSASAQEGTPSSAIDTLRIAMSALPPQLDPLTATWIVMVRVYSMVYDTLIQRDWANGGALAPGLATSWKQVDETTLDFSLRSGVTWQDGSPFTADDVKFTFDRTLQGNAKLAATGIYGLKEVVIVDDLTVRFITDGPRGNLLILLTELGAGIVPAAYFQKVGYEGFQQMPLGTGPYRVTEFVPDTRIRFAAHTGYWGGAPAASSVELVGIPEVSTRVAALINGEIDMAMDLSPDQVAAVQKGGSFAISSVAPLNANTIDIVGTNAPLDRKEIRQAMNISIDRQTIVEQLLSGFGVWPSGIQSKLDLLYTDRPPLPYDPDRARQLLKTAGYAGEEIRLAFDSPNYYPLEQEWTEAIVGMWTDVGLNVKMSPIDVNQRVLIGTTDPWNLFTSSTAMIADIALPQSYGTPTAERQRLFPPGQFDELNALVVEAQQTVDESKRRDLSKQALDFLDDFVMVLVLFTIDRITASKPSITFQESPRFGLELRPGLFSITA